MFSWAQPDFCATRKEFLVSKSLFLAFMDSDFVAGTLDAETCKAILKFVRENVFPYQDRFCFYLRKHLFHLCAHTNCGMEGTNNGIKNSSTSVNPTDKLDRVVKTLHSNAEVKYQDTVIHLSEKLNSAKLWSSSPTANHVTDVCESLLQDEWSKADQWISCHSEPGIFYVAHKREMGDEETVDKEGDGPVDLSDAEDSDDDTSANVRNSMATTAKPKFGIIPKFGRVHKIELAPDGTLHCSCGKFLNMGYPCRHVGCLLKTYHEYKTEFPNGFPLSSVRCFWWLSYYLYGMSEEAEHSKVKSSLWRLSENDTKGLCIPNHVKLPALSSDGAELVVKFKDSPGGNCLNYTKDEIQVALRKNGDRNHPTRFSSPAPAGFSQLSHLADTDLDVDVASIDFDMLAHNEQEDDHMFDSSATYDIFKHHYRDLCFAVDNAVDKAKFHREMREAFDRIRQAAQKDAWMKSGMSNLGVAPGARVSMCPPVSKKQKTHGTGHY
jgi:hypothetical protein